jgi:uncharacterized protein with HEPN domain
MQSHLKNDLLYLLRILEAIEKIVLYSNHFEDPLHFFDVNDGKEFNACMMLLSVIGEETNKISDELKEKYADVEWKKIKDFRNRIVHDYTGLDRFITFDIIKKNVPILKPTINQIIYSELRVGNFDIEEFDISKTSPYLKHVDFKSIDNL